MIIIDNMDKRPIYEQIVHNVEHLAVIGYYQANEQLPSVKQLACELSLNPNTIQRAYSELERRGIIYSIKGKGSFITADTQKLTDSRRQELFCELDRLIGDMFSVGITSKQIIDRVSKKESEGKK